MGGRWTEQLTTQSATRERRGGGQGHIGGIGKQGGRVEGDSHHSRMGRQW